MSRLTLALLLALPVTGRAIDAQAAGPAVADAPEPEMASRGRVILGPGFAGTLEIVDPEGAVVATLTLRPDRRLGVDLPAAKYDLRTLDGTVVDSVELTPGAEVEAKLPEGMESAPPAALPPAAVPVAPEPPEPPPPAVIEEEDAPRGARGRGNWKRFASPLMSAVIPGLGQMVNGESGKGAGILISTVGLIVGSVALARAGDPFDGAGGRDDDAVSDAQEIVTLAAYAGFTGALGLLYTGQIMDAHRVAARKVPSPRKTFGIHVDVTRSTTIGYQAGQPAYALYNDWTLSVLGQPAKRLTLGLTDMGFKYGNARRRTTIQAGLRVGYRVFDRRRLWINLAIGSIFQGTTAAGAPVQLDPGEPPPADVSRFGATLYGQIDLRIFVLDRWSLNLIPRFSVPMDTRYYSFNRSLPRYAPTFELGTGVGVYF